MTTSLTQPLGELATGRVVSLSAIIIMALDEWAGGRGVCRLLPHPRACQRRSKLDSFAPREVTLNRFEESDHFGRLGVDQKARSRRCPEGPIAARLEISRTTVVKAVQSAAPPKYQRRAAPTSYTLFEERVRALLADEPDTPATVITERVSWPGSSS